MKGQAQQKVHPKDCSSKDKWIITRRDFLRASVLAGLSAAPLSCCTYLTGSKIKSRFGIVTDSHYADVEPRNNRYYRESADKMAECVELMNRQKVDFLAELGDFKDQDSSPVEERTLSHLQTIEQVFRQFQGPKYHVLGNHDMDSISKGQFLKNITNTDINTESTYYSFDSHGIHFVVLDANYRADGTAYDHGNFQWTDTYIPAVQLDWLRRDLAAASIPVIIFVHQRLDGEGDPYINNAEDVREILQTSGKVLAVFAGHKHEGDYYNIAGIHYYTLRAMVDGSGLENNSYAIIEVLHNRNIIVTGYRKAVSMEFSMPV
jgi:predicted phosphodiesterase